jgi:uncharacterized membrane protein (DUF106 family)
MALISPLADISLIALAVVALSRFLQSKLIDKEKQKAAQASMKEKQAKIKELMKNSDEKSKQQMDQLQKEMFEEMNESMQGSLRYMMFSLPVFFGAFFILGQFYGGAAYETPFMVPLFKGFHIFNPLSWIPVGWGFETGWLRWYFLTYLFASIILGIAMKVREKLKKSE